MSSAFARALFGAALAGSVLYTLWRRLGTASGWLTEEKRTEDDDNVAAPSTATTIPTAAAPKAAAVKAAAALAPPPAAAAVAAQTPVPILEIAHAILPAADVAAESAEAKPKATGLKAASGAALLTQLRSRQSTGEEPHLKAYYAASRASKVTVAGAPEQVRCRHGIKASECLACRENSHGMHGRGSKLGSAPAADDGGLPSGVESSRGGSSESIDGNVLVREQRAYVKAAAARERAAAAAEKRASAAAAAADPVASSCEQQPAVIAVAEEAEKEKEHAAGGGWEDDTAGWELVRQHNSESACWIVIGGRVLDATGYLGHHPGGASIIFKLAGKDATRAYERAHHSRAADMKLADFTIGKLSDVKRLRRAARQAHEVRERLEKAAQYL